MFGLDRDAAELTRLVARKEQHTPSPFCIPFEHPDLNSRLGNRSHSEEHVPQKPHYTASTALDKELMCRNLFIFLNLAATVSHVCDWGQSRSPPGRPINEAWTKGTPGPNAYQITPATADPTQASAHGRSRQPAACYA